MNNHKHKSSDAARQTDSALDYNSGTRNQSGILRRLLTVIFGIIILIACICYIGRTFQWKDLWQVLKEVNVTLLILGGGVSIVAYWMLRTLRWYILLRRTDTHVPLLDLYMCTAVSLSFALFTPLQSGEMLKIELLKKYGMIQRSPGYGSFLVERALDLATLLTMACVSLLTTLNILPNRTYVYYILGCMVLMYIAGFIALSKLRLKGRSQLLMEHMRQCVGNVPTLILVTVITCASWASVVLSWQVFLYSGGIQINFVKTVALMSIVSVISILSLIPGGVGVSEIGTSQMLIHFGYTTAVAQAGSLILRSYSLVAIVLGVSHLGFWKLIQYHRIQQSDEAEIELEPVTIETEHPSS